eukprot:Opistho-1_new@96909
MNGNAIVKGNTATKGRGGGVFYEPTSNTTAGEVQMEGVTVSENTAGSTGGGVHIFRIGTVVFANVNVTDNRASIGGGVFNSNSGSLVQNDTLRISGNTARQYGYDQTSPGTTLRIASTGAISVATGFTLPNFALTLYDAFGALAKAGGSNYEVRVELKPTTAPTVRAQDPRMELRDGDARNLDAGATTFGGMRLFGSPGTYNLTFRLTSSPDVAITVPVVLIACESLGDHVIFMGTCVNEFSENKGLRYAFLALGALGEFLAVVVFITMFLYRDHDIIKASSPLFCSIIIGGCMVGYATIFTMVPTASDATCGLNVWFGHLAFTITFSALFAKNFRIMAIFNNRKMRQRLRATSDTFLLTIVAVVCAIVVIYLIIWSAVDLPTPVTKYDASKELLRHTCESNSSIWAVVLYAAEAGMLAWGVYLAWKTKSVPSKFRESKYIALAIWNITVIAAIILPLTYSIDQANPDTQFMLTCVGLFVATTGTLTLIFGPKAYMYIMDDKEAAHSGMTSMSGRTSSISRTSDDGTTSETGNELRFQTLQSEIDTSKVKYDQAVKENMDLWDQIDRLHRQVDQLQERVRQLTGGGEALVAPDEKYRATRADRSSIGRHTGATQAAQAAALSARASESPARPSDPTVSTQALITEVPDAE